MKNKKRTIPAIGYILVIAGIIVAATFAIGMARSEEFSTLVKSPIAHTQLKTAREVNRFEHDREISFGKPIYPEVLVVYEPIDTYTKKDVFNEILAVMNKDKWQPEKLQTAQEGYYVATTSQDNFIIVANLSIDSQSNKISVSLSTRSR